VARVVVFAVDLLFGSNVQGLLAAGGHDAVLASSAVAAATALADGADVLMVDLTSDADERIAQVGAFDLGRARTLGFFAHVEPDVREAALAAGFDLVVPRSRVNREGAELVSRLAAT
jgi:hypothetical protein